MKTSATTGAGVPEAVAALEAHGKHLRGSAEGARRREQRARSRLLALLEARFRARGGDHRAGVGRARGSHARDRRPARGPVRRGGAPLREGRGPRGDGAARMKALRIDHLGVAVRSIDETLEVYRALGLVESEGSREDVPGQQVRVAFLPVGESRIELLEPSVGRVAGREVPRAPRPGRPSRLLRGRGPRSRAGGALREGLSPHPPDARRGGRRQARRLSAPGGRRRGPRRARREEAGLRLPLGPRHGERPPVRG